MASETQNAGTADLINALTQEFVLPAGDTLLPRDFDEARFEQEDDRLELLGFHVADLNLACDLDSATEITDLPSLYRLPHLPHWLLGVANIRGDIIPVASLTNFLGLEGETTKEMLVIVGKGEDRLGLVVDGLPDSYPFLLSEQLHHLPPLPEALTPHARRGFRVEERLWVEIDILALIDELAG